MQRNSPGVAAWPEASVCTLQCSGALQAFLDVKEHLTAWWLKLGYHGLTALFLALTVLYGWAALSTASSP